MEWWRRGEWYGSCFPSFVKLRNWYIRFVIWCFEMKESPPFSYILIFTWEGSLQCRRIPTVAQKYYYALPCFPIMIFMLRYPEIVNTSHLILMVILTLYAKHHFLLLLLPSMQNITFCYYTAMFTIAIFEVLLFT